MLVLNKRYATANVRIKTMLPDYGLTIMKWLSTPMN